MEEEEQRDKMMGAKTEAYDEKEEEGGEEG